MSPMDIPEDIMDLIYNSQERITVNFKDRIVSVMVKAAKVINFVSNTVHPSNFQLSEESEYFPINDSIQYPVVILVKKANCHACDEYGKILESTLIKYESVNIDGALAAEYNVTEAPHVLYFYNKTSYVEYNNLENLKTWLEQIKKNIVFKLEDLDEATAALNKNNIIFLTTSNNANVINYLNELSFLYSSKIFFGLIQDTACKDKCSSLIEKNLKSNEFLIINKKLEKINNIPIDTDFYKLKEILYLETRELVTKNHEDIKKILNIRNIQIYLFIFNKQKKKIICDSLYKFAKHNLNSIVVVLVAEDLESRPILGYLKLNYARSALPWSFFFIKFEDEVLIKKQLPEPKEELTNYFEAFQAFHDNLGLINISKKYQQVLTYENTKVLQVTSRNFDDVITYNKDYHILLLAYSHSCIHSVRAQQVLLRLVEEAVNINKKLLIAQIDILKNPEVNLNLNKWPVFMYYNKNIAIEYDGVVDHRFLLDIVYMFKEF